MTTAFPTTVSGTIARHLHRRRFALGQITLSALLSLPRRNLQIQIPSILANKAHVTSEHRQLSDDLPGGGIGKAHERLWRAGQLVRCYFQSGTFFHGIAEGDDFALFVGDHGTYFVLDEMII